MKFRHKISYPPMDDKFKRLADYNSEVSRGIVHTAEYDAAMAELQAEFNAWIRATYNAIES